MSQILEQNRDLPPEAFLPDPNVHTKKQNKGVPGSNEEPTKICSCSENGRNLVVCIDGTSNQFGDMNTNVIELYSLLRKDPEDKQRTWYNSGIGTYAQPSWKSLAYWRRVIYHKIDLAIAWNFEKILMDAYRWLSETYKPNDRIFLFGFSRGAYQVRALSGMIEKVGLIHRGNEMQIPFAFQLYADPNSDKASSPDMAPSGNHAESSGRLQPDPNEKLSRAQYFKQTFSRKDVKVHFVGVWDTVSSIGVARSSSLPLTTEGMNHVCYFRHALALDERRVKFMPEYAWGGVSVSPEDEKSTSSKETQQGEDMPENAMDLEGSRLYRFVRKKEVWFAGTHSDIGGGNVENADLNRSRPPLRWMCFEADAVGLRIRAFKKDLKSDEQIDSTESLKGYFWPILEYLPIRRLTYEDGKSSTYWPHQGNARKIQKGQKVHVSLIRVGLTNSKQSAGAQSEGASSEENNRDKPVVDPDTPSHQSEMGSSEGQYVTLVARVKLLLRRIGIFRANSVHTESPYIPKALPPDGKDWKEFMKEGNRILEVDLYDSLDSKLEEYKKLGASNAKKQLEIQTLTTSAEGLWVLRQRIRNLKKEKDHLGLIRSALIICSDVISGSPSQPRRDAVDELCSLITSSDVFWMLVETSLLEARVLQAMVQLWSDRKFEGSRARDTTKSLLSKDGKLSQDNWAAVNAFLGCFTTPPSTDLSGGSRMAVFSPDRKLFITDDNSGTIRIWNVQSGLQIGDPIVMQWGRISFLAFSHDGKYIVAIDFFSEVGIWKLESRERLCEFEVPGIFAVHFLGTSGVVAYSSTDNRIHFYDVERNRKIESLALDIDGRVESASPTEPVFAFLQEETLHLIRLGSSDSPDAEGSQPKEVFTARVPSDIYETIFSPDGKYIAVIFCHHTDAFHFQLFRVATGEKFGGIVVSEFVSPPCALCWGPDQRLCLLVAGFRRDVAENYVDYGVAYGFQNYNVVRVWDAMTGRLIGVLGGFDLNQSFVSFSKDGRHVVARDVSGFMKVWDVDLDLLDFNGPTVQMSELLTV